MAGMMITRDAGLAVPVEGALQWRLVFCPPDKRRRDLDNLYSSMKNTSDGIFAALGADDSRIKRAVLEFGPVEPGGAVYVEIKMLEA